MNHRERIIDIEQGGFVLLLLALTAGLAMIVWPFISSVLWAAMAAIIFRPLYDWMLARMPRYPNRAAAAALLVILFAVLLPALWLGSIVVREAAGIVIAFRAGDIDIVGWFRDIVAALPETIRAAALAFEASGRPELMAIWQRADADYFGNFRRQSAPVAYQTMTAGGPVDHVPATPDLDPAYHTGLSLLSAVECVHRAASAGANVALADPSRTART